MKNGDIVAARETQGSMASRKNLTCSRYSRPIVRSCAQPCAITRPRQELEEQDTCELPRDNADRPANWNFQLCRNTDAEARPAEGGTEKLRKHRPHFFPKDDNLGVLKSTL